MQCSLSKLLTDKHEENIYLNMVATTNSYTYMLLTPQTSFIYLSNLVYHTSYNKFFFLKTHKHFIEKG